MRSLDQVREIQVRREMVNTMVNRMTEEGVWDSLKAKDVPDQIVSHVLSEIELGKDLRDIRREMGIKSQTSKEWQKISAAIKMGYRINSTTYFHRLVGRNEKISTKLYRILDTVLDQDIESLKDFDPKGRSYMQIFCANVTPMIDALNRLQQGTVKIGKDLSVFADPQQDKQGGTGGVTIVVKSHITLPSADEMVKKKLEEKNTIEAEVVQPENKIP